MASEWATQNLTVVVFGASGDLAKKKTFPALFDLFSEGFLPSQTVICGYSRSKLTNEDLHKKIKPYLDKKHPDKATTIKKFLDTVIYRSGQYGSPGDLKEICTEINELHEIPEVENRIYYFALPPKVFIPTAQSVKSSGISKTGFTRLIVEKPFGHDTASATQMAKDLGAIFKEDYLYRIDHYLGKEMVKAMLTLRFSNAWLEPLLNNNFVQSVMLTFKEDIGTEGRGGYFDSSGIIRDIMQNHLMQVLCVLAMEPPHRIVGEGASNLIRNEKVKLLQSIKPWKVEDTVIGQYVSDGTTPGYKDDETVPNDSKTPTFACTVFKVNNRRWSGVPFIMKAGKALDERKCEVRIQLKPPTGVAEMFQFGEEDDTTPLNEIVIRVQPRETVYIKSNVKTPGLSDEVSQTFVDLTYDERYPEVKIPDAYTRLVLDVLKGSQENFVRSDELLEAWRIVTPLLEKIEGGALEPKQYTFGTRGPEEADEMIATKGKYVHMKK